MKGFLTLLISGIFLSTQLSLAQNTVLTSSTVLPGGGSGSSNVAIGTGNTYPSANLANSNVFVGKSAGIAITTGDENVFTGPFAGTATTSGFSNVFSGAGAGRYNTSGNENVMIGYQSGFYNTTAGSNTFVGTYSGRFNTTGSSNSFFGYTAGNSNTMGGGNTFIGTGAGYDNSTGQNNSLFGFYAGLNNTTGSNNVMLGVTAGFANTTGQANCFAGNDAGYYNTSGNYNTFFGNSAGKNNSTGSRNTYLGIYAGGIGTNSADLLNATAIGSYAYVGVSNGLVLGDTTNVKVGIGTAYPNQKLTLRGNMNFVAYDNSLRLKNQPFLHFNEHESLALGLGAKIPAGAEKTLVLGSDKTSLQIPGILDAYQPNTGQFLTINEQGRVMLTQPRVQVASIADWSDKVFEPGYALRPLGEVEAFVKKHKHLPGVPSAESMVTEGMEAAAFNAKLLEKIEELTLYVVALEKKYEEQELRNSALEAKLTEIDALRNLVLGLQKSVSESKN
jgi:trimeric autotransporter adhesin